MPIPETPRQRRWSFAAEARGELPKGTARKWARETKAYCKCRGRCDCKHCERCGGKRCVIMSRG